MKKIILLLALMISSLGFSQTELLTNGDFENGTSPWVGNNFSVVSGEAYISSTNAGGNLWDTQLVQGGLAFVNGQEYTLTFWARAAADRTVEVAIQNVGAWDDQFRQANIALTTTMTQYTYTFNATSDNSNVQIGFLMAGTTSTDAIYYDDISLVTQAADPTADATLSNLTVDGVTVSGFSPNTLDYNVGLPQGTTVVPTVVATTAQPSPASAVVTPAASIPGSTTVLVTAPNGIDTNTYTINFSITANQTFDLTFESGAVGSVASNWNVFENDSNPVLEVVANPNPSGVNTSATVAKITTLAGSSSSGGRPWAGCESQHGTMWEWELDGTTTTITMDVYKTVISDVGIKMVNTTSGTIFQLVQPNTVTNAWETLTYDISSFVASGENHDIDQIVVFPDWQDPRATDNITYFDNISWEGLKTADAPVLGVSDYETTELKVYPNPSKVEWNIKANGQIINSIEVFDILGKQVVILKPNATDVVIDASTLNKGIYLAKVVSSNSIKTIKLVKN